MDNAIVEKPHAACGAKRRQGGAPCKLPAGTGTNHLGVGRCKYHGGATPIKSGRYSTIQRERLRDLISSFEADPEPLNILPELAAMRSLFQDFIERYDAWREALLAWHASFGQPTAEPKPREVLDLTDAYRILAEVTKIVERIEKIRANNAISRPELSRVLMEMARVVERYVSDPPTLTRIKDGWLGIRLG